MNGFLRFFLSGRNLLGMSLALVGVGLLYFNIISLWWPLVVGGLYLAGFLLGPKPDDSVKPLDSDMEVRELLREFDRLVRRQQRHLSHPVRKELRKFQETAGIVVDRLNDMGQFETRSYVIRQTVAKYLPEMLGEYLEWPTSTRQRTPKGGRSPRDLLVQNLQTVNAEFDEILDDLLKSQVDKLEVHGKFLEQRFGNRGSALGE